MSRELRFLVLSLFGLIVLPGCHKPQSIEAPQRERLPVEVEATVDRAVATTGDLITYRVRVDADAGYEVEVPEVGAEIAGFRIVDIGSEEPLTKNGRIVRERWYQLRADLVGSYVLPTVEVAYRPLQAAGEATIDWQTTSTSEIFVEVASVLPSNVEAEDIKGLKPLRRFQPAPPWVLIAAVVVAAVVVAALVLWLLRRRAARREKLPPVPAHELAFAELGELRRLDLDDAATVRAFYFRVSEVIRTYIEGRFGMNATDLTSEEIVADLGTLGDLDGEQKSALQRFLADTDQVKFAHREPSEQDIEVTYERALSFVESTLPASEPSRQEAA